MKHSIILFDGVCNYCNSMVSFIIANDKNDHFRFAPQQSDAGKKLLEEYHTSLVGICNPDLMSDSFYLIEDGQLYSHSTAAFKVLRHLNWYLAWLYFLIIIPRFIRDFIYNLIARNRYKIFGKRNECMVPDEKNKWKFLS